MSPSREPAPGRVATPEATETITDPPMTGLSQPGGTLPR